MFSAISSVAICHGHRRTVTHLPDLRLVLQAPKCLWSLCTSLPCTPICQPLLFAQVSKPACLSPDPSSGLTPGPRCSHHTLLLQMPLSPLLSDSGRTLRRGLGVGRRACGPVLPCPSQHSPCGSCLLSGPLLVLPKAASRLTSEAARCPWSSVGLVL